MYKDITIYSRDDRERKPEILESETNGVKFKVHKHIYYGDMWLLSCKELNADKIELDTEDMEEAKEKAIIKMVELFGKAIAKYQKAIADLSE